MDRFISLCAAVLLVACAAADDYPGRRGSSPGSGKADGNNLEYGHCASAATLELLNASTTNRDVLAEALEAAGAVDATTAAEAALISRDGEDGEYGTPDDEPFSSIGDLLHPATGLDETIVRALVDGLAEGRCDVDLASSVDWSTAEPTPDFAHLGTNREEGTGINRESSEIEVAFTVRGIAGSQLHAVLEDRDGFRKIRKNRIMEAFTYAFAPDEMPWSRGMHAAREGYPLVAVSIESERFPIEAEELPDGTVVFPDLERELALGTDLNTDVYYDTRDFTLLNNASSVRGRIRWDRPDCIRRILIAAKLGSGAVDPITGIKDLFKVDIRSDASNCNDDRQRGFLAGFDRDIRAGIVPWHSDSRMAPPLREVYERLANPNGADWTLTRDERGSVLPDAELTNPEDPAMTASFAEALALEPKMHLFSVRSRFHFNEATDRQLDTFYARGRERVGEIATYLQRADAAGRSTSESEALRADLERAFEDLPVDGGAFRPMESSIQALSAVRATASETDQRMHDLAARLGNDDDDDGNADELDRILTGARDEGSDHDRVDAFVAWRKIVHIEESGATAAVNLRGSIVVTTVMDPFRAFYLENMSDPANPDHATTRAAFEAYAIDAREDGDHPYEDHFDDFEELGGDESEWALFAAQLDLDYLQIARRQVEAAGSMARTIGFDAARELYVPDSRRMTSNFLIDTIDFTEFFTPTEWAAIDEAEHASLDYDARHILHTTLVNELQIELGSEEAYVERIDALDQQIRTYADANRLTMSDVCAVEDESRVGDTVILEAIRVCDGARQVFATYQGVLSYLAEVKGEKIVDRIADVLDDNAEFGPMPEEMTWGPSQRSKGETALLVLSGRYF